MEPEADLFKILPEDKIPQKGKILISEPFLPDNFFNRTVVYLADHTKDGSVGFILNRPLDIKVREAVSGFDNLDKYLNLGGPVSPDTLHYLHCMGDDIPKSVWVDENIYWGGDIEYIRNLIDQEKMNKSQIRFFLGYSGWAAGQLEKELKDNSWVIVKVSNDIVLNDNNADKNWKRVLRSLNNKYRIWADFPESPDMN
ncbi:MAG TPA: YqgE/AlgH family protein [Bacteroidales bacterium]|jgi:putative transcriptional regulator|nr:YqgE/AlgH family protein [Bacteroidales bacterium]HPI69671.1 YqgE/AlgH family protein [Bacteroidales bacterium]